MNARTKAAAAASTANATTVAHTPVVERIEPTLPVTPIVTPEPAPAPQVVQAPPVPEQPTVQTVTRTPEQQAELDKLRANRDAMAAAQAQAAQAAPQLDPKRLEALSNLADLLLPQDGDAPQFSWKRRIATFFVGLSVSAGVGYGIQQAATWGMAAVMSATGSTVLVYAVAALAIIIGLYLAYKAGSIAANYVLSGQLDEHIGGVKDTVVGWFKRKPVTIVAAAPAAAQ